MKIKFLLLQLLTVCFLKTYSQSIAFDKIATIEGEDAFEGLKHHFLFDTIQAPRLYHLVLEREKKKMDINCNENDVKTRVSEKYKIDSQYQDSINAILIPFNPNISGRTISMALRLSKQIRLSHQMEKTLMEQALDYARRLKADPYVNFSIDEMNVLKKVLSSGQLEFVIDEKNKARASDRAQKVWKALKKFAETEDLDSSSQVIRAEMYYSMEMRYHDLFVGQDEIMWKNLNDLYRNKPKVIKMYEALEEKQRIKEKEKTTEKRVRSAFSW